MRQRYAHREGIGEHLVISDDILVEQHFVDVVKEARYSRAGGRGIGLREVMGQRRGERGDRQQNCSDIAERNNHRPCALQIFETKRAFHNMEYQPVLIKRHPRPSSKRNPESRYWRQFKHPVFVKEYAPVTAVHFSPTKPHRYAVTAATRIQIYAPRTQKVVKTISRFKDVARSGNIRQDGKLVVAGDDSGLVQVRDSSSFLD